jgi:hypothetical protein
LETHLSVDARTFALWSGIAYLGAGVLGFVPAALQPSADMDALAVTAFSGYLLGLFPVNFLETLVHIAAGAWGIAASQSWGGARAWCKTMAILFGVIAIMGFVPGLNTMFGMMPLHGHNVWLHGGFAIFAAFFGWRSAPQPAAKAAH